MADFLKAFESIDTDFSGEITRDELEIYCKKQNFDETFIEKWLNLFDMGNTGTITIEEYCEVLGLRANDDYIEKVTEQRAHAGYVFQEQEPEQEQEQEQDQVLEMVLEKDAMEGVRIISVDGHMTDEMQRTIVRLARRAQDEFSVEKDIAKYIKSELDILDQRAWHAIVGRFQYGSYCTHEIGCMFHFFVNRFAVLVWRTPDY